MEIAVQPVSSKDVAAVSHVAQITFAMAGPSDSSQEEIKRYIDEHLNEAELQQLVQSDEFFFAHARHEDHPIGYIVVKYCSRLPDIYESDSFAQLQRLYVLPKYHGTISAKSLVTEAFRACSNKNVNRIWLSVFSENDRAKRFYSKFGFQEIGSTIFKMGNEDHLDTLMMANVT